MNNDSAIFGCYISYPALMYGASEKERETAREQGDLFSDYVWGEMGISGIIKKLKHGDYGKDLILALFEFYVKPLSIQLPHLKDIESYRKNEKSIGIPIIVTDENFFEQSEEGRYNFLKQSIFQKLELLTEVVKKRKLDTNVEQLKCDLRAIL